MGTTQSVYGMVDAAGDGGLISVAPGDAALLYPDVNPLAWATARIAIRATAAYGAPAPGNLRFSVQKTHDQDVWYDVTIRNIAEVYDGVTPNPMASDTIQVAAVVASGETQEIAIGLREPAPYMRLRVANEGATAVEVECHLYTTG